MKGDTTLTAVLTHAHRRRDIMSSCWQQTTVGRTSERVLEGNVAKGAGEKEDDDIRMWFLCLVLLTCALMNDNVQK